MIYMMLLFRTTTNSFFDNKLMNSNVKYRMVGLIRVCSNNILFPVIKITGNSIRVEYALSKYTMLRGLKPLFDKPIEKEI